MSVKGAIHSIETFGSVDGPGVRFVIFLKGCAMRCQYCHNPDTWKCGEPNTDSEALLKRAMRYRSYWGKNGGITVSGGEPLLQIDFLLDLFQKAKKENIHTVLDTAGNPFTGEGDFFDKFQELMNVTDLILLDLKVYDEKKHRALTEKATAIFWIWQNIFLISVSLSGFVMCWYLVSMTVMRTFISWIPFCRLCIM